MKFVVERGNAMNPRSAALGCRRVCFAAALLSLLALGSILLAAQKSSSSYNITATLYNDVNNNPYALQSDGTNSAVYSPSSSVLTYLYPSPACTRCGTTAYEWALDVTQSSRWFLLTLTPLNGSPAGPFSGTQTFNGKLRSRCFDPGNNVYSWLAIQSQDTNCAMRVNFTYGRTDYTLVMSPLEAGTGTATVICTNWKGSLCSSWTDLPTAGVANANVAHLYSFGKGGAQTLIGSYALSFYITLTHP
jgi:hypothetical protein